MIGGGNSIFGVEVLGLVVVFVVVFVVFVAGLVVVALACVVIVGSIVGSSMVGAGTSVGVIVICSAISVDVEAVIGDADVVGIGSCVQAILSKLFIQRVPLAVVGYVMRSAMEPSGRTSSTTSPLLFRRAEASGTCQIVPFTDTRESLDVNLNIDPVASCRLQLAALARVVPVGARSSIHSSPDSGAGNIAYKRRFADKDGAAIEVMVGAAVFVVCKTLGAGMGACIGSCIVVVVGIVISVVLDVPTSGSSTGSVEVGVSGWITGSVDVGSSVFDSVEEGISIIGSSVSGSGIGSRIGSGSSVSISGEVQPSQTPGVARSVVSILRFIDVVALAQLPST